MYLLAPKICFIYDFLFYCVNVCVCVLFILYIVESSLVESQMPYTHRIAQHSTSVPYSVVHWWCFKFGVYCHLMSWIFPKFDKQPFGKFIHESYTHTQQRYYLSKNNNCNNCMLNFQQRGVYTIFLGFLLFFLFDLDITTALNPCQRIVWLLLILYIYIFDTHSDIYIERDTHTPSVCIIQTMQTTIIMTNNTGMQCLEIVRLPSHFPLVRPHSLPLDSTHRIAHWFVVRSISISVFGDCHRHCLLCQSLYFVCVRHLRIRIVYFLCCFSGGKILT